MKGHTVKTIIDIKVYTFLKVLSSTVRLGAVAYACNPRLWEAEAGGSPEVGSLRPA